jgi:apolipoprotein N-acyltransferase
MVFGHPMQVGITVLVIMGLCGLGGYWIDSPTHSGVAPWLFFAALFLLVFGVLLAASRTYKKCRHRY